MKIILKTCIALCFLGPLHPIRGADPHLGAAIHMENLAGNPNYTPSLIIPLLPKTPLTMVRDGDAPNWRKYEQTQGVYTADPYGSSQAWIDQMSAAGYSIVFCAGFDSAHDYTPLFYPLSPFPTTQFAAFVKWFLDMEVSRGVHVAAFEVINEPNNAFAGIEGSNWETQLVNLSNAVADAVHGQASTANIPVIGLGAQGQQIIDMLAIAPTHLDGINYHPYDSGENWPEHTYQGGNYANNQPPPWGWNYLSWVSTLRSHTTLPLWETEWGPDGSTSNGEISASEWMTRRLVLTKVAGIHSTFIYQLSSGDVGQALLTYGREPRNQVFAINRLENGIAGMTYNPASAFTFSSSDPNFVAANCQGYLFNNTAGGFGATVWVMGPILHTWPNTMLTTVTFTVPTPPTAIAGINLTTGDSVSGLKFTASGSSVTVSNVPMGPDIILLYPSTGGSGGPPSPAWFTQFNTFLHNIQIWQATRDKIDAWITANPPY